MDIKQAAARRRAGITHRIKKHVSLLGWTPREVPVEANDGDLFWVVDEQGEVVQAVWNVYPRGGKFQNWLRNDEGMCGFTVTHYQPIIKPEAPTK